MLIQLSLYPDSVFARYVQYEYYLELFSFSFRYLSISSMMTSFFFLPPYSSITLMLNFFHFSSGISMVVFTMICGIYGFVYKCKRVIPSIKQHLLVSILMLIEGDKGLNLNNNLEAQMKRSLKIQEIMTGSIITTGFATIGFMKV
jgi:hypothetical protein